MNKALIHCEILKNNLSIVKSLLEYILSDINIQSLESESEYIQRRTYREVSGCPLMPLADLSIKPFPRNASDQVAITPIILHLLLPKLKSFFLHPTLLNNMKIFNNNIFLDSLFISKFSISFIEKYITYIIPYTWKLNPAICWLKSEPLTTSVGFFSRLINRSSSSSSSTTSANIHNNLTSSSSSSSSQSSSSSSSSSSSPSTNIPSPLLLYVLWNDYLGNNYHHELIIIPSFLSSYHIICTAVYSIIKYDLY